MRGWRADLLVNKTWCGCVMLNKSLNIHHLVTKYSEKRELCFYVDSKWTIPSEESFIVVSTQQQPIKDQSILLFLMRFHSLRERFFFLVSFSFCFSFKIQMNFLSNHSKLSTSLQLFSLIGITFGNQNSSVTAVNGTWSNQLELRSLDRRN